jgi:hypothetical protein
MAVFVCTTCDAPYREEAGSLRCPVCHEWIPVTTSTGELPTAASLHGMMALILSLPEDELVEES